ncbi:MAG: lipoate--protein ligase [Clostridiales bacterium]|nr:lipoate--protein ligase [Clostridiales bacterium]
MFYIETNSTDPYDNLAFEEYILCSKRQGDWLILWQNANTVVVGLNQNTLEEIDAAFVKAHSIQVVRRTTGGGAVYHDLGNLNYSFITDAGDPAQLSMERFTGAICGALAAMGVQAEAEGRNDIVISGKKVSGSAQRLDHGRILHHGTLLFRSDPHMVAGALNASQDKYPSASTKSVRSRIGNIAAYLPEADAGMAMKEFKDKLRAALAAQSGGSFQLVELSRGEALEVKRLAETKYRTWEWNYGASPPYSVKKRAKYGGGILEVRAEVVSGRIQSVAFSGDFMARIPLDPLADALVGSRYDKGEAAAVLARFPIDEMFGAIRLDEILTLMFS